MAQQSGLTADGKASTIIGVISILLGLVGIFVTVARCSGDDQSGGAAGGVSVTPSPEEEPTTTPPAKRTRPPAHKAAPPAAPAGGDPGGDGPVEPRKTTLYLSKDLKPKGGMHNWQTTGAAKMGGYYPYSLRIKGTSFTQGDPNTMAYAIPEGAKAFAATIGLDDDSDPGSSFNFTMSPGDTDDKLTSDDRPKPVYVPLHGERTLTLTVVGLEFGGPAVPSVAVAVWGNARFVM